MHTRTKPDFVLATDDDTPTDAPGDDCPDHGPYGDDECPKCACGAEATLFPLGARPVCYDCAFATTSAGAVAEWAVSLQSQAIERTIRTNRVCADPDCQGPHVTWQCPQIARRLFALEGAA